MAAKKKKSAKAALKKDGPSDVVLRLRIELCEDPPIWREVEVPASYTLALLHHVIQGSFDWDNSHPHEFKTSVKVPKFRVKNNFSWSGFHEEIDEGAVPLPTVLSRKGSKVGYLYDFGDCWDHLVVRTGHGAREEGCAYPRCIGGEGLAPPEDCGGLYGYFYYLKALEDEEHPDHETAQEWLGDEDGKRPDFSLDAINRRLSSIWGSED